MESNVFLTQRRKRAKLRPPAAKGQTFAPLREKFSFSRSTQRFPWSITHSGPVGPHLAAIHKHKFHAFGDQLRLLKSGAIDDRVWIKHDHVGFETYPNQTTIS